MSSLRPKRMSRVSVTGSQRVMDEVIEAVHELHLLHVTDYDDTWEGFEPGDPVEGAEEAAEKLVTVRALESTLGVEREDAGRARIIDDETLETKLEETRRRVNELDDRRTELRDEMRRIDDRIDAARPLAELGIDLDLLTGYDSLTTAVGEGDAEELRGALTDADEVEAFELYEAGDDVALFVYPTVDLEDVLVGTPFTPYELPDLVEEAADDAADEAADEGDAGGGSGSGSGSRAGAVEATSPASYVEDLERRRQQVTSRLGTVENELEDVRHDVAGFLLAAEEKLSIEVQKREAPLTFATTANAFVAEGWIPTERYVDLVETVRSAVGDHVEIEELERASFEDGHAHEREELEDGDAGEEQAEETGPTEAARDEEVVADGGYAMSGGTPPVIQDNTKAAKPFELLVGIINRPRYNELDPTLVLFLTFPAFFGFMIGDVGYGILYCLMGWYLMAKFDSPGFRSLGGVAIWAGVFTIIFGVLYGEFFGLHELGYVVFGEGGAPMDKGLSPQNIAFAWAWLIVSLVLGLVHLTIGYVFGFVDDLHHGVTESAVENLSWLLLMVGVWTWVFSTHAMDAKPDLLFTTFNAEGATVGGATVEAQQVAYELGFGGLPEGVGIAGLVVGAVGFAMLVYGEGGIGVMESLNVLVNILSYTRIAAVLLAKGGMAFVVNLLVFGAYQDPDGGVHFIYNEMGGLAAAESAVQEQGGSIMFAGLLPDATGAMFIVALLVGALIFVIGHIIVLLLGITAAGLQGIRLEYVEFFNKFYEGGGKPYEPFGYERRFTTED